jgi:hypothetical protein
MVAAFREGGPSMPVKKATRSKASADAKKSKAEADVRSKQSAPAKRHFGTGAMLVTAMCVTGAVIVIAAREMAPGRVARSNEAAAGTEVVASQPKPMVSTAIVDVSPVPTAKSEMDASNTSAASTAPTTIFGCLQRSNESYRLTDTDGIGAPKARSWKTAFLKKGTASVEVVDPGNRVRLSSHVGHRVGITGMLSDKQLQARSIRKISSSCGN